MSPNYQTKERIYVLDGLRGVAAIFVVLYHLIETYMGSSVHVINHAYLAVDFFFLLSGYVVSYAYDSKWGSEFNFFSFAKLRLIRLHPMVVFAVLLGGLSYIFQDCPAFPLVHDTSFGQVVKSMLLAIFCIPSTGASDIRGWGEMFCLNAPQWTLMFEYIANIFYALFLRKFSNKGLLIFTCLTAFLTINCSLNIDCFGLLGNRNELTYTMVGGWCWSQPDLIIGFTRLLFPFCCGMLLQRLHLKIQWRYNFWGAIGLLAVIFFVPKLPEIANGIYEMLCVLVIFPILIVIARGEVAESYRRFCVLAGELSYPMYITHFPIIYLQIAWVSLHPDANVTANILVSSIAFITVIAITILSHYYIELPVRKKLLMALSHFYK